MQVNVVMQGDLCRAKIDGEMTIYHAMQLKDSELFSHLPNCREVDLDLSGVTEIDSSGLQLLVAAKALALAHGNRLRLSNHSQAVLNVLELCELEAFFGDPVVISSKPVKARRKGASK